MRGLHRLHVFTDYQSSSPDSIKNKTKIQLQKVFPILNIKHSWIVKIWIHMPLLKNNKEKKKKRKKKKSIPHQAW